VIVGLITIRVPTNVMPSAAPSAGIEWTRRGLSPVRVPLHHEAFPETSHRLPEQRARMVSAAHGSVVFTTPAFRATTGGTGGG